MNSLESRISKLEKCIISNEAHNRNELGLKAMNAAEAISKRLT